MRQPLWNKREKAVPQITVRWSLGKLLSAPCARNWCPRPSMNGLGSNHSRPIPWLIIRPSSAASAACTSAARGARVRHSQPPTSRRGAASTRVCAANQARSSSQTGGRAEALIQRKAVVLNETIETRRSGASMVPYVSHKARRIGVNRSLGAGT
ncbi:hypothetical protein THIARS_90127 [Thiomonas delicata]|uniref:Uncharacterized protein n=1 Tax=Thiomonas delicata TaxID=364030 RepID=A0A238D9J0_THIDL|nr:hypothetical protein THIARS_90127 [Thiomonas delicata]